MSKTYKTDLFSQTAVEIEMIKKVISHHAYLGSFSVGPLHQIIIVNDPHLKALMSLFVKRSDLLNSSPCILCCLVPKRINLGSDYYLNRKFFLFRTIQRYLDFIIHSFKPLPRRLYSRQEEEQYIGLDMRAALGGILDKLGSQGLAYKFMLDIDRDRLSKILKVPSKYKLISLVCVGYPIEKEDELSGVGIHMNTFGGE